MAVAGLKGTVETSHGCVDQAPWWCHEVEAGVSAADGGGDSKDRMEGDPLRTVGVVRGQPSVTVAGGSQKAVTDEASAGVSCKNDRSVGRGSGNGMKQYRVAVVDERGHAAAGDGEPCRLPGGQLA